MKIADIHSPKFYDVILYVIKVSITILCQIFAALILV